MASWSLGRRKSGAQKTREPLLYPQSYSILTRLKLVEALNLTYCASRIIDLKHETLMAVER